MQPVRFSQPRRRSSLISLTPLIDVVFMLLLFFMLATSFQQWRSMDLAAARESDAPAATTPPPMILRVFAERIELDGAAVAVEQVARTMREVQSTEPGRNLVVAGQDDIKLQRLVDIMDALRDQGIADPVMSIGQ